METQRLNSPSNYTSSCKNIQEVRVNAEELAASFPESTRFDTPPSSLLNTNQNTANSFTSTAADTAFFPVDNSPTLEPITDSITGSEIREKEELRIHQNMQALANLKLRVEVPYFKQQELETYIVELKDALHQREEHLKIMGTSFRNLQRTFTNRFKDYENRVVLLENKNRAKLTIIKILCPLILFLSISPFLFRNKNIAQNQKQPDPIAVDHKIVDYTPPPIIEKEKVFYTVKSNDTLSAIAKKFYGDKKYISTIMKSNNLNSHRLKVGEKLLIAELDVE